MAVAAIHSATTKPPRNVPTKTVTPHGRDSAFVALTKAERAEPSGLFALVCHFVSRRRNTAKKGAVLFTTSRPR